ncbi:hypothetical protein [Rhodococcus qingshengii]|uniref:hypothetical protein n=1 Tax=Rhodococcus qingshengii TaxID=334542 RepID=UPI001268ADB6|nr:hypothetical protein [Rhodococcus qingshengii]
MSKTKSEGWLPPRTGGYVPEPQRDAEIQSAPARGGGRAVPPKTGGGVGNIHQPKRSTKSAEAHESAAT